MFIDNVHFQNTAQLVHVLTEKEVQFRLQVIGSYYLTITSSDIYLQFYTDQDHSLSGGHTRIHLYELISDFLLSLGF